MGLNNYLGNGRNFPPRNAREQGTGMDLLSAGPLLSVSTREPARLSAPQRIERPPATTRNRWRSRASYVSSAASPCPYLEKYRGRQAAKCASIATRARCR